MGEGYSDPSVDGAIVGASRRTRHDRSVAIVARSCKRLSAHPPVLTDRPGRLSWMSCPMCCVRYA